MHRHAPKLARLAMAVVLACSPLAPPAHGDPGPNPRAPLSTAAPVLALAMADDGTVLATTDDPGSTLPTQGNPGPDVKTWYLWSPGGVLLSSGGGDLPACASRLVDLCQSPVPAAAIAANAARFAIASNVASSPMDTTKAVLAVGHSSSGLTARQPLSFPAVALAMDHDGSEVAVLERVSNLNAADSARIEWFDVGATDTFTAVRPAVSMPGLPTSIALSDDGARLAVVSDQMYSLAHDTSAPLAYGSTSPQTLSMEGGGAHSVLWGTAGGSVFYAKETSPAPAYTAALSGTAMTAVAQSRDGHVGAAGNATGHVRLLRLEEGASYPVTLGAGFDLSGAVRQMAFTPDGAYLLARTATQVVLLAVRSPSLAPEALWHATTASAPGPVGLSADAGLAAAAVGQSVAEYTVHHGVRGQDIAETVPAGLSKTFTLVYRNDGNRDENVSLAAWFPGTWFVTVSPQNLTVAVDGTATASVRVIVPAHEAPGTQSVLVNHTLASTGETGTTAIRLTVASESLVALDPVGPTSLDIRAGQTVTFTATLENVGNQAGTGHLSIATTPSSWTSTLSAGTVDLAPGAHANVTVRVTAPDHASEGDSSHTVLVLAERPQEPIDLYATVGAHFQVSLDAPATLSVRPGVPVQLSLRAQNTGTVPDSFDLGTGSLPEGWSVEWAPGNETLRDVAKGATATGLLTLNPPADAAAGTRFMLKVSATSEGNPQARSERSILVTVLSPSGETLTTGAGPGEGSVPWVTIGVVALAVAAVGGFVGGAILLRRKS